MDDQLLAWQRQIDAMSPSSRRIIARHDVPFGHAFRMWSTDGTFVVYVSRGWVEDLPHQKVLGLDVAVSTIVPPSLVGIPVVNESQREEG
jgi:hypothetical protein